MGPGSNKVETDAFRDVRGFETSHGRLLRKRNNEAMRFPSFDQLPATWRCRACNQEKPTGEMVIAHLRVGGYLLRARCKACHNARERGHRREWKTAYLRKWRKYNAELNKSYWRKSDREEHRARSYAHFLDNHNAILIQGRLRRRLDMHVSLDEAKELLRKYGRCYPTRFGLTKKGIKEVERIRSRLRRFEKRPSIIGIRMMVYSDGLHLKPSEQPDPFRDAASRLRRWHASRRAQTQGARNGLMHA